MANEKDTKDQQGQTQDHEQKKTQVQVAFEAGNDTNNPTGATKDVATTSKTKTTETKKTTDTAADYERQIKERDERILALEAQVADAAKSAEAAETLRSEIAELKAQGESDRVDFALKLAGCRNVKAARAVLDDHGGDVEALKEAEPWLFEKQAEDTAAPTGTTGLPNAGTASDEGRTVKRWRKIAGLEEDDAE